MATNWTAFYPYVVPSLPGAPLPLVDHHIREAVREFCERSLFWRANLTPIDLIGGTHSYPLTSPTGARVHRVNRVEILNDAVELTESNEGTLDILDPLWRTGSGDMDYYLMVSPIVLRIVYTPTAALVGGLKVSAALKPLANATDLQNDDIVEDHAADIASGVFGKLMAIPKKPYTDLVNAVMHEHKFDAACGAAAVRRMRDFTRRPARVKGYDR